MNFLREESNKASVVYVAFQKDKYLLVNDQSWTLIQVERVKNLDF